MVEKIVICQGHLINTGHLSLILNIITTSEADYDIITSSIGKFEDQESFFEILLKARDEEAMQELFEKLSREGVYEKGADEGIFKEVTRDKYAPEDFYSTTNHRTEVFCRGAWRSVRAQRMDASIRLDCDELICTKLRDLKKGDKVLTGSESVRVKPEMIRKDDGDFGFMTGEVSSERSYEVAVNKIAGELSDIKQKGGKAIVVAGPVVVHTGGIPSLCKLLKKGYFRGFLGGNAIAVHDLESVFFGTSLGVDLTDGKVSHEGHNHHMKAINKIYGYGSIAEAVKEGAVNRGLMHTLITEEIPYCLAGSIRDDGPLPETVNDMIEAQRQYAEIIKGADMILMLSTMLHSIGTGNMTPSWVKTVCIDINPAVVTKLSDRGSGQAVGIVSDVGLFLRVLSDILDT